MLIWFQWHEPPSELLYIPTTDSDPPNELISRNLRLFSILSSTRFPPTISGRRIMFSDMASIRPSGRCPSVHHLARVTRDISLISGDISTKLDTNIRHLSRHCWRHFQGHKSKVKVICIQMCEWYNVGGCRHFDSGRRRLLVLVLPISCLF